MRAWYSDHFEVPLPEGHRFPMAKYRALKHLALARGALLEAELEPSVPIGRDELLRVHDADYVDACFAGTLDEAAQRRLGFPWSLALLERSRASAYGTLAAARHALDHGFGSNLAGGTHHAHRGFGSGYCMFNDLAIAAATLLAEGAVRRVLVVDLDVHQGDGTAAIFQGDERVVTFSMHGRKNFPFRKQVSSRDVELEDGCTDATYLSLLHEHVAQMLEASAPDLVLYQAGVDALESDALGRLALTPQGLRARDAFVFEACRARALPVVLTQGGGYSKPIEATVEAHVGTWLEARRVFG